MQREPVNKFAAVKNANVVVSRSHSGDVEKMLKIVFGDKTPITPAGGAGYKVLEVIFGNATNYVHLTNIKKWDLCAGNAIINALNGKMTTLKNQPITYERDPDKFVNTDGVIATLHNHDYYAKQIYNYMQQAEIMKSKSP